jgi:hypothetical protein
VVAAAGGPVPAPGALLVQGPGAVGALRAVRGMPLPRQGPSPLGAAAVAAPALGAPAA